MSDFEELKLSVTLTDNASAGLANIRGQLTQLIQTSGQVQTAFAQVASSVTQVGTAHAQAAPKVSGAERALKELSKSAEETTRGMLQMGLAARRGMEALPEMALGFREAMVGLKGVSEGMANLAPAAALGVRALGALALGVAGVGAAVVAYGVSVFKFSQEIFQLSQTAKALGVTFAEFKNVTEQTEKMGGTAEAAIAGIAGMQRSLTDLAQNGSQMRRQFLALGGAPGFLESITGVTDPAEYSNKVVAYANAVEKARIEQDKWNPVAARGARNQFLQFFGVDVGAADRERLKEIREMNPEERKAWALRVEQSKAIAKIWGELHLEIKNIGEDFLAWGLPGVREQLKGFAELFTKMAHEVKSIKEYFSTIESWMPKWLKDVFIGMAHGPGGAGGVGAEALPEFGENAPHLSGPQRRRRDRIRRQQADPMFVPTSFGAANDNFGGGSGGERAQAIIKGGVFEALIDFYNYMKTGGTGSGGFQNASFGGTAGAAGARAGGAAGFGSTEYPNLGGGGGGGGAGGGQVPSGLDKYMPDWAKRGGGGGGGGGGPGGEGSTTAPSGNLAAQRAGFMKELEADPQLKAFAIDAMQHEGGIQSNMEQLFNYAAMRKMTIRQALHSGQYGPVNTGRVSGRISAGTRAAGEAALGKVGAGSNITDYATDQGMRGDPNFAKYMSNRAYWNMHKVEGAWFSSHGERGRQWAQSQRAADQAAAAKSTADTSKNDALGPMSDRYSSLRMADEAAAGPSVRITPTGDFDRSLLDRSAIDRQNGGGAIKSSGQLSVDVNAPPGTKVDYSGDNLLRATSMQRQTQMMPTDVGPTVGDTARSYMRGGAP